MIDKDENAVNAVQSVINHMKSLPQQDILFPAVVSSTVCAMLLASTMRNLQRMAFLPPGKAIRDEFIEEYVTYMRDEFERMVSMFETDPTMGFRK